MNSQLPLTKPISVFFTVDKGHRNPPGMCSSVLDLALGFLEEPENDIQGIEQVPGQEQNRDSIGMDDETSISPAVKNIRTMNLFEILRARIDDEKPIVRVKALQTFAIALGLSYPKCKGVRDMSLCGEKEIGESLNGECCPSHCYDRISFYCG